MAEHSELVNEMPILEKLGTQERLKMAKKRRLQQLKKWNQKEKELVLKRNKKGDMNSLNEEDDFVKENNKKKKTNRVHFVSSVMLLEAAARNDVEEVRRLLMMGVDPDSTNEDGLTALHQCCIDNSEEMMKLLVEFGANVNAKDSEQWTPLHAASTCGNFFLVRYLIDKGANLLAVNADGNMPYDICEQDETLDYIEQQMAKRGITQQQIDETRAQTEMKMLEFLKKQVEKNVDLNTIKFDCGSSALHVASANGYISVVEFLLENGMSTNINDDDNWQPIHAAACWGHPDVLEILAQAGADLNALTKNGETPLDICEDLELKEQIKQLKSEMETKKLLQQQILNGSSRLKRSHSQNTRSQSVRRTSIREKNKISRREALEEAKIRHHMDEKNSSSVTNSYQANNNYNSASSQNSALSSLNQNSNSFYNKTNQNTLDHDVKSNIHSSDFDNNDLIVNDKRKNFTDGHIDTNDSKFNSENEFNNDNIFDKNELDAHKIKIFNTLDSNKVDLNMPRNDKSNHQFSNYTESLIKENFGNHKSNGHSNLTNSNNYPTNCSNINTLSDLKKLRTDIRHRNHNNSENNEVFNGNNVISLSNKNNYDESKVDGIVLNNRFDNQNKFKNSNHLLTNNHNNNYLTPSPNSTLKKFRGVPSDMVGEIQKKKCCSVM